MTQSNTALKIAAWQQAVSEPSTALTVVEPVARPAEALVDRAALQVAVTQAALAVEKRNTITILGNCHLEGTGDALIVTATDLDHHIKVTVPAITDRDFCVTVPAHNLAKLLTKAKASDDVAITDDGDHATFDLAELTVNVQTLPVADFPMFNVFRNAEMDGSVCRFTMPANDLADAVKSLGFAVCKDETRYYLNGIYIHAHDDRLRFVATDGYKLAIHEIDSPLARRKIVYCASAATKIWGLATLPGMVSDMPPGIIHSATIAKLVKLLAKAKGRQVQIGISQSAIQFIIGDAVLTAKLIDGTYPDYHRVLPRESTGSMTIDARAMIAAIGQVSIVSSDRGRAVKFTPDGDGVTLAVYNPDTGSATMTVPAVLDGDLPHEIGFNGVYMTACLQQVGGDAVLHLSDPGAPARITGTDERMTIVLMPMRV